MTSRVQLVDLSSSATFVNSDNNAPWPIAKDVLWPRLNLIMAGEMREVGGYDVEERRCGPVTGWGKAVEVPELE